MGVCPISALLKQPIQKMAVDIAQSFLNRQRKHSTLGYLTPWQKDAKAVFVGI